MVTVWRSKGFNPVPLAATDIMTGLQTGMIDAYPPTPLFGLTLQWYRQTPNMVGMGMAPLVRGVIIVQTAELQLSRADRPHVQSADDLTGEPHAIRRTARPPPAARGK